MIIYIVSIIMICINMYIFRKNNKYFCISSGIILWLLIALRHISIGLNDTENVYLPYFEMITQMNIVDILNYEWMPDKLFYIVMKLISIITSNYQVFIAIMAIPFTVFVMVIIYKYSKQPLLSVIIFISLYYAYAFFLMRQVIAMGIVFYSFKHIKNRKVLKFIITILIASLFHNTAVIFLIAYPICRYIKFGVKNYIAIIVAYLIAKLSSNLILQIVEYIDFSGRITNGIIHNIYQMSDDISIVGLLITVSILIISTIYYKKLEDEEKDEANYLLNLSTIGSTIYCFSGAITEFYRVALYFSLFNVLLLPNTLSSKKNKKDLLVYEIVIGLIFVIYFLTRTINNIGINPYMFFWE